MTISGIGEGRLVPSEAHDPVVDPDQLTFIFSHIHEAVLIEDEQRLVKYANTAFTDLFAPGVPPEALVGGDCDQAAVSTAPMFLESESWLTETRRIVSEKSNVLHDVWQCADGRWLDRDYFPRVVDGVVVEHLWVYRDVTQKHLPVGASIGDHNLKGTYLQRGWDAASQRFERSLAPIEGSATVSVVLLKLLVLERINSELGSHVGDQLIVDVLAEIRSLCPEASIERVRGATIAVGARGIPAPEMVNRLRSGLESNRHAVAHGVLLRFVQGASQGEVDGAASLKSLLDDAFVALGEAVISVSDVICDEALLARTRTKLDVEARLRPALLAGEFEMHYQPVRNLDTMEIVGAESLMRWNHPERGLLSAGEFIPAVEALGLVSLVDLWVIDQACSDLGALIAKGIGRVGVNLSTQTIASDVSLAHALLEALARNGFGPEHVVLEITETAVSADVARTIQVMQELHQAGFDIAIDDFGVGTSNLALLKDLHFDYLKLDKSFIDDVDSDRVQQLIKAICAMAGILGGRVIAEGIENVRQLEILRDCGVQMGQGWFIGLPEPVNSRGATLE